MSNWNVPEGWEVVRYDWSWLNLTNWVIGSMYGLITFEWIRNWKVFRIRLRRPKLRIPVIRETSHNRSYRKEKEVQK